MRVPRCISCGAKCEPNFRSHDKGWLCPSCWETYDLDEEFDPDDEDAMSARIERITDKLYRRRMKDE